MNNLQQFFILIIFLSISIISCDEDEYVLGNEDGITPHTSAQCARIIRNEYDEIEITRIGCLMSFTDEEDYLTYVFLGVKDDRTFAQWRDSIGCNNIDIFGYRWTVTTLVQRDEDGNVLFVDGTQKCL